MNRIVLLLLVVHVVATAMSVSFMDQGWRFDNLTNATIDVYEFVGFGNFFLGTAIVTVVLVAVLLLTRRRRDA
ncbi:MAG: hypothetical protein ACYTGN_06045 [Planctomycetota bacterium]